VVFVLNAYPKKIKEWGEHLYLGLLKAVELDKEFGKEGHGLEEFKSKMFLESFGEPQTHHEFLGNFRAININYDKFMSLVEYAIWKFSINFNDF